MTESLQARTDVAHPAYTNRPETPEGVAFGLMELIFFHDPVKPGREDILSTYVECLRTVKGIGAAQVQKKRTTAPMQDELAESRPASTRRVNE